MSEHVEAINITAIWLRRIGDYVEVIAEINGVWRKAITEHHEGAFSHIAEARGAYRWDEDDL